MNLLKYALLITLSTGIWTIPAEASVPLLPDAASFQGNMKKRLSPTKTPTGDVAEILDLRLFAEIEKGDVRLKQLVKKYAKSQEPQAAGIRKLTEVLEKTEFKDTSLILACDSDPDLMALAYMTLFIRRIELRQTGDKTLLVGYLRNFTDRAQSSSDPMVLHFSAIAEGAKRWVENGFPFESDLPLQLKMASSFDSISDVPKDVFIAHHKSIKNRPVIPGLKVTEIKDRKMVVNPKVVEYIKGIDDPLVRKAENLRFAAIRGTRDHVAHLFAKNTYQGKITFQKRTISNGFIKRANKETLDIATSAKGKTRTYKWEDMHVCMFADILEKIATRRENVQTREGEAAQRLDAGEEYLQMAVLYVFAGMPEKGYTMAVKAESMSPKIKDKVRKVFCDSLPDDSDLDQKKASGEDARDAERPPEEQPEAEEPEPEEEVSSDKGKAALGGLLGGGTGEKAKERKNDDVPTGPSGISDGPPIGR